MITRTHRSRARDSAHWIKRNHPLLPPPELIPLKINREMRFRQGD
jgi:hypothetical protein